MWCYQKPGFETLLVSELQRQQQRSQFCDTMLKAEDVSVPAHSLVLSAISPHVASVLSSAPVPPAGRCHLLEFPALGACTLRRMVELLYSGEMAGEGEEEKQEAISAAAKLGIHGLVEVTRRSGRGGGQVEVGIQTEPLMQEDNEGRGVRWRREVRNGNTLLWKEILSTSGKDMWTQTEELQVSTAPAAESAASTETIDISVLQVVKEADYQIIASEIPHIPISLLYGPEDPVSLPPSAPAQPTQASTAAGHTSGADATTWNTFVAPPPRPTLRATTQAATSKYKEVEEWQDEEYEQFHGNIPGFINYFLNPDKERGTNRGTRRGQRQRGRPRGGTGNTRGANKDRRPVRRPRGSRGGRAGGKLTQLVDTQHVGVSMVQKTYLQKWGRRSTRTGQGGGAAGRKLFLKSRELVKSSESRRRSSGKVWEMILTKGEKKAPVQHFKKEGLPGSRTSRAKSTASYSSAPAPCNIFSSPHPRPSPSSSFVSPAASLLHTTALPPPDPPPPEEQPEQIERLMEEVMRELDILSDNNSVPSSHHPCATDRSCHGSAVQVCPSISAEGEVHLLQQQGEGELNDMLDRFLQSFEQHIENSMLGEERDMNGVHGIKPLSPLPSQDEDPRTSRSSLPRKTSAKIWLPPHNAERRLRKGRAQRKKQRRSTSRHSRSLEKEPASESRTLTPPDLRDKQLLQIPVVKLERRGLQEPGGPVKSSAEGKGRTSLESLCCDWSKKIDPNLLTLKDYPIRSRLRKRYCEPNVDTSRNLRPRGKGQNSPLELSTCSGDLDNREEYKVELQESESTTKRRKKRVGSEVETSEDAPAAKMIYIDQQAKQVSESCAHTSRCVQTVSEPGNAQAEEGIEMVSLNDREEREEINVSEAERGTDEEAERDSDETINIYGDGDTRHDLDDCRGPEERGKSAPLESQSEKKDGKGSTGSDVDDDIDVIGGCSPPPEPMIISWTESSKDGEEEDEAEDIDVVGDDASSAILTVHGANCGHDPAHALQTLAVHLHAPAHKVLLLKMAGELFS